MPESSETYAYHIIHIYTRLVGRCPGHGQVDDCPYSTILARQDDFYYKNFDDWCATREGILPRRDGSTSEERSLASWFRHKLRLYYSDDLSDDELVKLKKIPAIHEHFCLHGQWSLKFALKSMNFEDWCAKHRRLLPQQAGGNGEERTLADWLKNAISRNRHGHNGKHSENQVRYLRKISVPVDLDVFSVKNKSLSRSECFDLKCKSFEDWCAQHGGSLPKRSGDTQEERSLAIWLMNKLFRYRRSKLSDDQLVRLRELSAISEVFSVQGKSLRSPEQFVLKCKSFEEWCAQHDCSLPKQKGDTQEEKSLGSWLMNMLFSYRRGKLSDDQLAQLRKIPAISDLFSVQGRSFRSKQFAWKCQEIAIWCAQHSGSLPKQNGETQEERSLASWLLNKLYRYRRAKLSDDQLAQLNKIPAICDLFSTDDRSMSFSKRFDNKCKRFQDWCAQHSGSLPKQNGASQEEKSLAIWLRDKLVLYRLGKLSDGQQAKLRHIPVISEVLHYKGFTDWCATHDGTFPRRDGLTSEERSLASWFKYKLHLYHSGELSDEELVKLKKIPATRELFCLQGHSLSFALKCKNFEDWCTVHNGSLPKQSGHSAEERSLANWLKRQISNYRKGTLSEERLANLKKIPVSDDVFTVQGRFLSHSERFHLTCRSFEDWCAAHNGTLPKQRGTTKEERSLAVWLKRKLYSYRKGKLPDDQLVELRKIPVVDAVFTVQGRFLSHSERFHLTCRSFEDWCAAHNETLPKQRGTTKEERSLAVWLKRKLYSYRKGKLPDDQLVKLRKIPVVDAVFTVQGRFLSHSERFHLTCRSFEDWCATHNGTLPKQRGTTKEERSLADWLMTKLRRYRHGKLPDDQLAQLRKIPPISDLFSVQGKSFRSEQFVLKCKSFEDWCAQHSGSLPKHKGDTQEERALAIWLMNKLSSYRHGKLSDDQLAQLRKIPAICDLFRTQV